MMASFIFTVIKLFSVFWIEFIYSVIISRLSLITKEDLHMIKNAFHKALLCIINCSAIDVVIALETNPSSMFNMLMSLCNSDEKRI